MAQNQSFGEEEKIPQITEVRCMCRKCDCKRVHLETNDSEESSEGKRGTDLILYK